MSRLNKTSAGESIYRCRESGKELAAYKTLQCKHCGFHWDVVPGSGRQRGWCMLCHGPTCGRLECQSCVPIEQWLENVEAGRPEDFRPIKASVPLGFDLIIPELPPPDLEPSPTSTASDTAP